MQCDLFIQFDLDLGSNFEIDIRMSKGTYFDASRREDDNGAYIIVLSLSIVNLFPIKNLKMQSKFGIRWPVQRKPFT